MKPELVRRATRFGLSGILATTIHVTIAAGFIQFVLPNPPLANGIAFLFATMVSYLINTLWTFSGRLRGQSFVRFLLVSLVGFFLAVTISWSAELASLSYMVGIACVVSIMPPITFLMHYYWTYR